MGLEHHLVFWGNYLIWTIGFVCCYLYNSSADGFIANYDCAVTFKRGYIGRTQSSSLMLICTLFILVFMAIIVYRSAPWKQRIYKNIPLSVLLLFNFVMLYFFFFSTESMSAFGIVPISNESMKVCLFIMVGTAFVNWLYNMAIERKRFHEENKCTEIDNKHGSVWLFASKIFSSPKL